MLPSLSKRLAEVDDNEKVLRDVFTIFSQSIMRLVYPPKFCITIVPNFSWVLQSSQEKYKTMVTEIQTLSTEKRKALGAAQPLPHVSKAQASSGALGARSSVKNFKICTSKMPFSAFSAQLLQAHARMPKGIKMAEKPQENGKESC